MESFLKTLFIFVSKVVQTKKTHFSCPCGVDGWLNRQSALSGLSFCPFEAATRVQIPAGALYFMANF